MRGLSVRVGAAIWLLLVLIAAALLVQRASQGLDFDADLQALLPTASQSALQQRALQQLDLQAHHRVLVLVGHRQPQQAAAAGRELVGGLRAMSSIRDVQFEMGADQWAEQRALYAPVQGLLLSPADRELLAQRPELFAQRALRALYSPRQWVPVLPVQDDPLGIHQRFLSSQPAQLGAVQWRDGMLQLQAQELHWVLIQVWTADSAFGFSSPEQLLQPWLELREQLQAQWPGAQVLAAGLPLHGAHAAERAQWEMRVIGIGSLLAVVLLLLLVFRSPRPLLLTLSSIATGLLLAAVVSSWLFKSLHLIALVMGASLIGITVDYAFHFLCAARQDPLTARQRIGVAISLGLLTTTLAYAALLIAPFPGLRQIAVISIAGLLGAWLTVMLLYPWALRRSGSQPASPVRAKPPSWRVPQALRWSLLALTAAAALAALGTEPRDSVRTLYQPPAALLADDQQVSQLLQGPDASRLFVIEAPDTETWLQRNEALLELIRTRAPSVQPLSVAQAVPSQARQHQDRLALQPVFESGGALEQFAERSGLQRERVERLRMRYTDAGVLSLHSWLASSASAPMRGLWAGADQQGASGVVLLAGELQEPVLQALANELEGVHYLNRVDQMSDVLTRLRWQATQLLLLAFGLAAAVLMLRYGWRGGLACIWPAIGASAWVLGVLAILGLGFSLFHLLALLLVLGMGLDYAIFLRESPGEVHARHAILMAAVTTLLAFGLLALSQTPALRDFGQTVAIGIAAALLLAFGSAPEPAAEAPR